ncbi:MAG: hypothetical protein ACWGQW_21005, partial [bacterium]
MARHDNRCTTRKEDWTAFYDAISEWSLFIVRFLGSFIPFLDVDFTFPKGRVGHEAKNIVVEGWRRWTGKCPDTDIDIDEQWQIWAGKTHGKDEHEP